jgi:uncharacterized membrane protein YfcA
MKQLFRLESFQKILFFLFLTGVIIGALYGIHVSNKLRNYSIIPFFPVLYIIIKGLYKNIPFFINDFKLIDFKQ